MTTITVNGREYPGPADPRTHLADYLRDTLHLTATHLGCEHGVCGACTILLDDDPARACLTFPALTQNADIRTLEGLADDPIMTRLRDAFSAEHALQCGYCTAGMLITARDIVLRLPEADAATIRLELAGNLCRCTGYDGIVRAIGRVLAERPAMAAPPRPAIPTARFERSAPETAAAAPAPTGGLRQRLEFPVAADALWTALHDPALLAACIPGAAIERIEDGRITGTMQVALGPIRARFRGDAVVTYDEAARAGTVSGGGGDTAGTRVSATAAFRVEAAGASASVLLVEIDYTLRGALAQLARLRVVDMLAGELGAQFGRNLARRIAGGPVAEPEPVRAASLGFRLVIVWLQRLFRR